MKILKRIKNLIKLSKIELTPEKEKQITNIIKEEPHRMAQIIKRKDPIEEFLKKENV